MLRKESSAVKQGYGHHGKAKVRSRADGVSGEHAKAAAVARHSVLERNLHGKISDKTFD
jgi:hypothetical protein